MTSSKYFSVSVRLIARSILGGAVAALSTACTSASLPRDAEPDGAAAGQTGGGTSLGGATTGGASGTVGTSETGGTGAGGSSGTGGVVGNAGTATTGGSPGTAGAPGAEGPCTVTSTAAICRSKPIETITNGVDARRVYWNEPTSTPPVNGYPAVILYQGSLFGPSLTWEVSIPTGTPFGGYFQVALVAKLIENGFVVIQPEAQGGLVWHTNDNANYDATTDAVFIPALLDAIKSGKFGPIDETHLYATGISSGGYMTSRMAVSYPGVFRALAIESGSYATCLGPLCAVPSVLPKDHPPTLFLHGTLDTTVPISTAKDYYDKLKANGITTDFIEDPSATHQWLAAAPEAVTNWFLGH